MAFHQERLEKIYARELAEVLRNEVKNPLLSFVTVTKVTITKDLSIATIYYTVMGDENEIEATKKALENAKEKMSIYIAVETLEFLKKGGRVSATTATVANVLNIKPILKLGVELLESYKNARGMKKAKKEMLEAIRQDLEVTFKEYHDRGEVYLLAASSADEETTKLWV